MPGPNKRPDADAAPTPAPVARMRVRFRDARAAKPNAPDDAKPLVDARGLEPQEK